MWKILWFFGLGKRLFLWVSLLLLINKKCANYFRRETANENKITIWLNKNIQLSNSCLNKRSFQWYRCESDIDVFARRVTWNYAYSPCEMQVKGNKLKCRGGQIVKFNFECLMHKILSQIMSLNSWGCIFL